MYTQNSNRAWKRNLAKMNSCNRAARRNAARILASLQPTGPAPTDTVPSLATVQRVYSRPYIVRETGVDVWHMIRSAQAPEGYAEFKGPFKTTRGAEFAVSNPSVSVAAAERDSKLTA